MNKKILITGGCGFIGSHLSERFLSLGCDVLVIDNFSSGNPSNLPEHERLMVYEETITDIGTVDRLMGEFSPDIVIHAAVSPVRNFDTNLQDVNVNIGGTLCLLDSARACNVDRFIYFQTALCYGPTTEPLISLDHPLQPQSSYAISKTCAERYIMESGLDFISFRLANHYGPRNLCGPVPIFFNNMRDGIRSTIVPARRDFVFVNDLVDLVEKACYGVGESGVYHVASGVDYSILDLYLAIAGIMGIEPDYTYIGDYDANAECSMRSMLLDATKTYEAFDWRPKGSLVDGLSKAVDWYKIYGAENTYTHLKVSG